MRTSDDEELIAAAKSQHEVLHLIISDLNPGDQLTVCRGDNIKCKPPYDCAICARITFVEGMTVADIMAIVRNVGHA